MRLRSRTPKRKPVHAAPPGWKVWGFERWVCGGLAYSHEMGTTDGKGVTCRKCKERRNEG